MLGDRVLNASTVKPATAKGYWKAVSTFLQWLRSQGVVTVLSAADLDLWLCRWLHVIFRQQSGAGKQQGVNTLYGILFLLPALDGKLPDSLQAVRGWRRLVPPKKRPPTTWPVCQLMSACMALRKGWRFGVGNLLAFDCLLRLGELCSLRRRDIVDGNSPKLGVELRGLAIRLPDTKTGSDKWVLVLDDSVCALMRLLLARPAPPGDLVFGFTPAEFRSAFADARDILALSPQYVPHCNRHGAATRLLLLGWPIADILSRGRWSQLKSAEYYVQSGRALLLTAHISPRVERLCRLLQPVLMAVFSLLLHHQRPRGGTR